MVTQPTCYPVADNTFADPNFPARSITVVISHTNVRQATVTIEVGAITLANVNELH